MFVARVMIEKERQSEKMKEQKNQKNRKRAKKHFR